MKKSYPDDPAPILARYILRKWKWKIIMAILTLLALILIIKEAGIFDLKVVK